MPRAPRQTARYPRRVRRDTTAVRHAQLPTTHHPTATRHCRIRPRCRLDHARKGRKARVQGVIREQETRNAFRQLDGAIDAWRRGVAGLPHEIEQFVGAQPRVGVEFRRPCPALAMARAEQGEDEIERWTAAHRVFLQAGEEPLESRVELRRERQREHSALKVAQPMASDESRPARVALETRVE